MKLTITIILVIALGGAGYYFFLRNEVPSVTGSDANASETSVVGRDVIAMLDTLNSLDFDKKIFTDEKYQSLDNNDLTITNRPVGRANPFSPAVSGVRVTTAPTVTILFSQEESEGDETATSTTVTSDSATSTTESSEE